MYRCPAGDQPEYRFANIENGLNLRRYWTYGRAVRGLWEGERSPN